MLREIQAREVAGNEFNRDENLVQRLMFSRQLPKMAKTVVVVYLTQTSHFIKNLMKIIQAHPTFYVELSPEEIFICPKKGICSSYPIWLGKNRAIMRDVIAYFEKNPPQTFLDCLAIIGRFELNGMSSYRKSIPDLFSEDDEELDTPKTFW